MSTSNASSNTLLPPRLLSKVKDSGDSIECSVHTLPKPLVREFHHVFAEKYLSGQTGTGAGRAPLDLLAIPTNQRARMDLVNIGDHVEEEKDRLLNTVSWNYCSCESGRTKRRRMRFSKNTHICLANLCLYHHFSYSTFITVY